MLPLAVAVRAAPSASGRLEYLGPAWRPLVVVLGVRWSVLIALGRLIGWRALGLVLLVWPC